LNTVGTTVLFHFIILGLGLELYVHVIEIMK
jgi:hypothetical protein